MKRRDASVEERDLCFRHDSRVRHEVDVAHRTGASDRQIKNRRADAAAEQSSLERAPSVVRNVEDRLVEQRLDVQTGGRKPELPSRIPIRVDSGVHRRPSFVEAERWTRARRYRGADMAGLMNQDAGRGPGAEPNPVSARGCDRIRTLSTD